MVPVNIFNPNLKAMFKEENLKNLQNCIKHCNIQLKSEQRSWETIICDNRITILATCAAITCFALNILFSVVPLSFIAVPLIYTTIKIRELERRGSATLAKAQLVFKHIFCKYGIQGETLFSRKDKAVKHFIKHFRKAPKKKSSLQSAEKIDKILSKCGDSQGLGYLAKMVFIQVIKDQKHLDKIHGYQICNIGVLLLFVTQNMDQLFSRYPLVSTSLIALARVIAVFISGYAAYNCIKHWNDREIGKDAFREALPELNDLLEIPQELRA